MIKQLKLNETSHFDQFLGKAAVFHAGFGISGRMVVDYNCAYGSGQKGTGEDFNGSRMAEVCPTDCHDFVAQDLVGP